MKPSNCTHLNQISPNIDTTPATVCEGCQKIGDTWVKLRRCLVCGNVGCCDSSKNTHATEHFKKTSHAIIQSAEPGETWRWCHVDKTYV